VTIYIHTQGFIQDFQLAGELLLFALT